MISDSIRMSLIQRELTYLDVGKCKIIAKWLREHIKQLELDVTDYNKNLWQYGFSVRACNALQAHGIYTIQQLIKTAANWDDIRKLKGVGNLVEAEIRQKVKELKKAVLHKPHTPKKRSK